MSIILVGSLKVSFVVLVGILLSGVLVQVVFYVIYKKEGKEKAFIKRKTGPAIAGVVIIMFLMVRHYLF